MKAKLGAKTKPKKVTASIVIAGPLQRFVALLCDITIAVVLHKEFLRLAFLKNYATQINNKILIHLKPILEPSMMKQLPLLLNVFIPSMALYITFQIVSNLIVGVSLSQFMFGIRVKGNPFLIRIMGIFRSLLAVILGPFLMFDLPCLFTRRTLKEIMTLTVLQSVGGILDKLKAGNCIPVHGLLRFYALMGDISLTYCLYYFLKTFASFQKYSSELHKQFFFSFKVYVYPFAVLSWKFIETTVGRFSKQTTSSISKYFTPLISEIPDLISPFVFNIVVLLLLYSLISTLLFGVTISQLAVGIHANGSFIGVRLAGLIRVILTAIVSPFVIFDLPSLLKKRTIKEIMTFTTLTRSRNPLFLLGVVLAIPFFIIMVLFAPLTLNPKYINGLQVSLIKPYKLTKKQLRKIKTNRSYSNSFNYSSKIQLPEHITSYVLLPSASNTTAKDDMPKPQLWFYNMKKHVLCQFDHTFRIDLPKLFRIGNSSDLLFKYKFPNATKFIGQNLKLPPREKFVETDKKTKKLSSAHMSKPLKMELLDVVQSSLELGLQTSPLHIIQHGPFLESYVKIRNYLLKFFVEKDEIIEGIKLFKMQEHKILQVAVKPNPDALVKENEFSSKDYFIPLTSWWGGTYSFRWQAKDAVAQKDKIDIFKHVFGSNVEWLFEYKDIMQLPETLEDFNMYHVFDFYNGGHLPAKYRMWMEEYIIDKIKLNVDKRDGTLFNLLTNVIKGHISAASKPGSKHSRKFLNELKELKKKLSALRLKQF